ncbi:hypothetical protein GCM10027589_21880 [Actinocorallia lasiicapitis]
MWRRGDGGAATLWVVAVMGLVWTVAGVVMVAGGVRAARHRAQLAADSAALAVVTREVWGFGDGCRFARELTERNGAAMESCEIRGAAAGSGLGAEVKTAVMIRAPSWVGVLRVHAVARAGQIG